MVKYVVLYEGRPEDPEAFDRYYAENHVRIIRRWPGVRAIQVNKGAVVEDPAQRRPVGHLYQVCEFYFDSMADLERALASPARAEASADRGRFPAFHGTIRHQALEIFDHGVGGPGTA